MLIERNGGGLSGLIHVKSPTKSGSTRQRGTRREWESRNRPAAFWRAGRSWTRPREALVRIRISHISLLTQDRHTQASSCSTTSSGSQSHATLRACPPPKGQPSRSRRCLVQQPCRPSSEVGTVARGVCRERQVGRTGSGPMYMKPRQTRLGTSRCSVWCPDLD